MANKYRTLDDIEREHNEAHLQWVDGLNHHNARVHYAHKNKSLAFGNKHYWFTNPDGLGVNPEASIKLADEIAKLVADKPASAQLATIAQIADAAVRLCYARAIGGYFNETFYDEAINNTRTGAVAEMLKRFAQGDQNYLYVDYT